MSRRSPICARHRVLLPIVALCAAVLSVCWALAADAAASTPAASWDAAQQRQVVAAGLMDEAEGSFAGAGRLSAAQANSAMVALAARLQRAREQNGAGQQAAGEPGATGEPGAPSAQGASDAPDEPGVSDELGVSDETGAPDEQSALGEQGAPGESDTTGPSVAPVASTTQSPVTVATFDRMLVEELGLADVASHVQETVSMAGLRPPSYFGSEVLARFLELRYEHPVGAQRFDLFPGEPITRAEAAWSLARAIGLGDRSITGAREALSAFALPQTTAAQRQALRIAVARIGYPYVWGGTTDNTADGLEHGGFDCSGFAWRVYKVSRLPWGNAIRGRTAAEQAGEIPRSQRLNVNQLEPGDLLFFGSAHFNSKATESDIIHEGIYLGDNWVIHSSAQGVYVLPLKGSWLGSSFAWGRRVIR